MLSRARDEPLLATAPPTQRWLLLEVPRAWPDKILTSSELAGAVPRLRAIITSRTGRVLFVRGPGRHGPRRSAQRSFVVVDALTQTEAVGQWHPSFTARQPADLEAALAAFAAPGPLVEPAQPRLLVCTHAKHDQCCAARGRPVVAALDERWPGQVWECSHLGGDRFAANVLSLPDATYLGRLDAHYAVQALADHRAGETNARFLRGVATQDPRVQAAVVEVLRALGPDTAYRMSGRVTRTLNPDSWRVEVLGHRARDRVTALVTRRVLAPERRTCQATTTKIAITYDVTLHP